MDEEGYNCDGVGFSAHINSDSGYHAMDDCRFTEETT